jgi:hypothetical protein
MLYLLSRIIYLTGHYIIKELILVKEIVLEFNI